MKSLSIIFVLSTALLLSACAGNVPYKDSVSSDWGPEGPEFFPNEPGGAQSVLCRVANHCVGAFRK